MFSLIVDSGKTGYVVDKKQIEQIRKKHGKKYPDFLNKDERRSYRSESIVGKLYRNARNYIQGKTNDLENIFAQLNINDDDDQPKSSNPRPLSTDQPMPLDPDSPLSTSASSFSITVCGIILK